MKKFVKVLMIIAACMAALGVLLTAFGLWWSLRVVDRLTPETAVVQNYAVDTANLSSIEIETGVAELVFETDDEARIEASGFTEGELTVEQTDGTLRIKCRDALGGKSIINLGIFRIDWLGRLHTGTLEQRIITLYLPEGITLDSFVLSGDVGNIRGALPFSAKDMSISTGAGNVQLSNLTVDNLSVSQGTGGLALSHFVCDELDLSGGVGEIMLSDSTVTGSAQVSLGMGNAVIDGGTWNALQASDGTGNLTFRGRLTGASCIDTGVGNAALTLEGGEELYAVTMTKGLGEITVTGAPTTVNEDGTLCVNLGSGAPCNVRISAGMGNVDVTFTQP